MAARVEALNEDAWVCAIVNAAYTHSHIITHTLRTAASVEREAERWRHPKPRWPSHIYQLLGSVCTTGKYSGLQRRQHAHLIWFHPGMLDIHTQLWMKPSVTWWSFSDPMPQTAAAVRLCYYVSWWAIIRKLLTDTRIRSSVHFQCFINWTDGRLLLSNYSFWFSED